MISMEAASLRIFHPKTSEELAVIEDIQDFINVVNTDHFEMPLYRLVRQHVKKGVFDEWLLAIEEKELADLLRPFQKMDMTPYGLAE